MSTNKFAAAAAKAVETGKVKEHDREGGGDFEYTPPAAGMCIGRLVTYVEVGNHPQKPYQGQAKPPAPECIVQFELLGKKHASEIEVTDEAGSKTKKTIYPIITLRMAVKAGTRAGYTKLLNALDYGRGNAIIPMMLGEGYKLNIIHNEVEKDGKKKVYANIKDKDGVWQISAPLVQKFDEETGEPIGDPKPVKAPEPTVELRCLMWDAPDIDQWNSLYIPGTFKRKEGDQEVEVSKNWLQNSVKEALNFEGSAVYSIVAQLEGDLPDISADDVAPEIDEDVVDLDEMGDDTPDVETTPDEAENGVSGDPDADPLADLGLDVE